MTQRFYWIGKSDDGSDISVVTLSNCPPNDVIILDKTYTNFMQVTKDDILDRQRKGIEKYLKEKDEIVTKS